MVNVYTQEDYAKSYTELIEILKYFSHEDLIKIPKETIQNYIKNKNKNYSFSYNPNLELEEQHISKLTLILLANLYIDYLATNDEKEYIIKKDQQELEQLEKQKQEKYNIENIFKNRKKQTIPNNETTSLLVLENKSITQKILEKIKKIFKLT